MNEEAIRVRGLIKRYGGRRAEYEQKYEAALSFYGKCAGHARAEPSRQPPAAHVPPPRARFPTRRIPSRTATSGKFVLVNPVVHADTSVFEMKLLPAKAP